MNPYLDGVLIEEADLAPEPVREVATAFIEEFGGVFVQQMGEGSPFWTCSAPPEDDFGL